MKRSDYQTEAKYMTRTNKVHSRVVFGYELNSHEIYEIKRKAERLGCYIVTNTEEKRK